MLAINTRAITIDVPFTNGDGPVFRCSGCLKVLLLIILSPYR